MIKSQWQARTLYTSFFCSSGDKKMRLFILIGYFFLLTGVVVAKCQGYLELSLTWISIRGSWAENYNRWNDRILKLGLRELRRFGRWGKVCWESENGCKSIRLQSNYRKRNAKQLKDVWIAQEYFSSVRYNKASRRALKVTGNRIYHISVLVLKIHPRIHLLIC